MTSLRDRASKRGHFDVEDLIMSVDIVAVIGAVVPLKKGGNEQRGLCPFHADGHPSLVVVPKMGKNGMWTCYGCSGGKWDDVIGFVRKLKGCDFRTACEYLGGEAAIELMDVDRERLKAAAVAKRKEDDEKAEKNRRHAYALWNAARPIAGTPAEQYLRGRGIAFPIPSTLRFAPQLWCQEAKQDLPAMVAAIVDAKGHFMALHRTYLARGLDHAWRKAALDNPKKILGRFMGGAVRLHPPSGSDVTPGATLYVAEGIETALSVLAGLRRRPHLARNAAVWAAGALANVSRLVLPNEDSELLSRPVFTTVVLCVDADSAEAAVKAENIMALHNYEARGCEVKVAWPAPGMDFNDMIQKGQAAGTGDDQVAQAIEDVGQYVVDPNVPGQNSPGVTDHSKAAAG